MTHFASPSFWSAYRELPESVREIADRNFLLLNTNPGHPSLHFKRVGKYWSARVGMGHRALAREVPDGLLWFWIGTHAEYDRIIR